MTTKFLAGGITKQIRHIEKADRMPHVHIERTSNSERAFLILTEYGDTRKLFISQPVAEALIANGMSYDT